jgi:hypothetical protein
MLTPIRPFVDINAVGRRVTRVYACMYADPNQTSLGVYARVLTSRRSRRVESPCTARVRACAR